MRRGRVVRCDERHGDSERRLQATAAAATASVGGYGITRSPSIAIPNGDGDTAYQLDFVEPSCSLGLLGVNTEPLNYGYYFIGPVYVYKTGNYSARSSCRERDALRIDSDGGAS